jgi:acetyl-CoA carboxylase biotin carboxyl carrier protein
MMLRRRGSLNYDEGATVKGPEPSAVLADMEAVAARLWTDIRPLPAAVAPAPAIPAANDHHVRAPLVGTFYRAPAPGEPPFVEIGDVIRTGQQVAIIEAMKMMVPVETDVTGRVTDILIGNGEPVEFGSSLVVVTGG